MQFGDKLKELRLQKGLTQKQLGDLINISDRVIGYYESNDRFPKDPSTLKQIANIFNVSVDYLIGSNQILWEEVIPILNKAYVVLDDRQKKILLEVIKTYISESI